MCYGLLIGKTTINNNANVTLDMLCLQDGELKWLHVNIKQFLASQNPPSLRLQVTAQNGGKLQWPRYSITYGISNQLGFLSSGV